MWHVDAIHRNVFAGTLSSHAYEFSLNQKIAFCSSSSICNDLHRTHAFIGLIVADAAGVIDKKEAVLYVNESACQDNIVFVVVL